VVHLCAFSSLTGRSNGTLKCGTCGRVYAIKEVDSARNSATLTLPAIDDHELGGAAATTTNAAGNRESGDAEFDVAEKWTVMDKYSPIIKRACADEFNIYDNVIPKALQILRHRLQWDPSVKLEKIPGGQSFLASRYCQSSTAPTQMLIMVLSFDSGMNMQIFGMHVPSGSKLSLFDRLLEKRQDA